MYQPTLSIGYIHQCIIQLHWGLCTWTPFLPQCNIQLTWKFYNYINCLHWCASLILWIKFSPTPLECMPNVWGCKSQGKACQCVIFATILNLLFPNWQARFPQSLRLSTRNLLPPCPSTPFMSNHTKTNKERYRHWKRLVYNHTRYPYGIYSRVNLNKCLSRAKGFDDYY